ncbi:MAG: gluconate:H+ symporter [Sphingobacteriales bacterium]
MPLLIVLAGILLLLLLIVKKLNPLLALLVVSIVTGLLLKMSLSKLLSAVQTGIGSTLGSVALVIVLGAILGKWMEESGAAHRITQTLVKKFGVKNIQWAVMLTGLMVGIPMFYNAGFVVLVPLVFALAAETGLPLLYLALPMAASLSVTHGLLPPHPSPVALAALFKANTGKILLYGLIIALPTVVIAGPLLGRLLKNIKASAPEGLFSTAGKEKKELLPASTSFFIALMPVFIILCFVLLSFLFPADNLKEYFNFFGDPNIVFLISILITLLVLQSNKKYTVTQLMKWATEAVASIAMIILIIAAGGVFKQVLIDGGIGDYIKGISNELQFPPLVLGWLIAALLRVSLGSATVAALTAAGIVAPLVTGNVSPELMVLSVGSGSLMFSHVNDTGFWMFKEYFNLSVKQTFLSWTVMETIVSVLGLTGVLLLNLF